MQTFCQDRGYEGLRYKISIVLFHRTSEHGYLLEPAHLRYKLAVIVTASTMWQRRYEHLFGFSRYLVFALSTFLPFVVSPVLPTVLQRTQSRSLEGLPQSEAARSSTRITSAAGTGLSSLYARTNARWS